MVQTPQVPKTSMMRALVMTGVQQIVLQQKPRIMPDEADFIEVKLHSCGICGSDLHAYHGHDERRIPPLILGHEAVGWAEIDGTTQRVALNPLMYSRAFAASHVGKPHLCPKREMIGMRLQGGMAEYTYIRRDRLIPLPEDMSFDAAVLAEPLACAVHAVRVAKAHCSAVDIVPHDHPVLVLGGGAIGLLIAQVLIDAGYRQLHMIEVHPDRAARLQAALPGVQVMSPQQLMADDRQYVCVYDAVGTAQTRRAASTVVEPGGVILHIGLQDAEAGLNIRRLTLQEVTFVGCYCYTDTDFADAIQLLAQQRVIPDGWVDYRPLADGSAVFQELHHGSPWQKIILRMT